MALGRKGRLGKVVRKRKQREQDRRNGHGGWQHLQTGRGRGERSVIQRVGAFVGAMAVIGVMLVGRVMRVIQIVLVMVIVGQELDVCRLQFTMEHGRQPEHRQKQSEQWTEA